MIKRRAGLSKKAPVLFGLALQLLFSIRAALPQVVICHRAGGGSAVEFDADGACLCDECEHCRARRLTPHAESAGSAWEPCHCRHEAFSADDGGSSLRLPDRQALPGATASAAGGIPEPAARLSLFLSLGRPSGLSPGPPGPGAPFLRC